MAWFVYQVALVLLLLVAAPFLVMRRGRHYFSTFLPRLGLTAKRPERASSRPIWLHAVSVGEVGVAAALAQSLPKHLPLVVSTITPTGLQEACRLLGDRAEVCLHPFEFGFALRRFFASHRPRALVIVEGDLWPLALHFASRKNLRILVVNGRISDRNFARLRLLRRLIRPLLGPVSYFAVQSDQDQKRLLELGVPSSKVEVTGNLKFDSQEPHRSDTLEATIRTLAGDRAVLVAGSTMAGEEDAVLDAFDLVGGNRALLILAPRHQQRWPSVAENLKSRGVPYLERSQLENLNVGDTSHRADVLLLDTLGELAGLYAIANGAFVGGTLVDTGRPQPARAGPVRGARCGRAVDEQLPRNRPTL